MIIVSWIDDLSYTSGLTLSSRNSCSSLSGIHTGTHCSLHLLSIYCTFCRACCVYLHSTVAQVSGSNPRIPPSTSSALPLILIPTWHGALCDGRNRPPAASLTHRWWFSNHSSFFNLFIQSWTCDTTLSKYCKPSLGCLIFIDLIDLHYKSKKFKMAVSLLWCVSDGLLSTHATRARLRRERACAYPAIVSAASFLFHLSPVCPPVPSLPHTSVDPGSASTGGRAALRRRHGTESRSSKWWNWALSSFNAEEQQAKKHKQTRGLSKTLIKFIVFQQRNTSGDHIA